MVMGERELITAVNELRASVLQLDRTLKEDYPKRAEINKDRKFFAWVILAGLILSAIVGGMMTVGIVSGCFLSKDAVDGQAPTACGMMPGYTAAQERNRRTSERFNQLLEEIKQNQEDIAKLKAK